MGGWIKLEKDLERDVRVRRIARELCNAGALQGLASGNAYASLGVTLVLGALARLWMHADTFARKDDTVELTPDEINELTGIEGFAQLMPLDWLQVLDSERVKLPGFQEHNGTDAKRRALTQKRVSNFRAVNGNASPLRDSKLGNAGPLPDQDQDQDQDQTRGKRARAPIGARLPPDFALTPERRAFAESQAADPDLQFAQFRDYWTAATKNATKRDWDAAWRTWCRNAATFDRKPTRNGSSVAHLKWRPTE